MSSTRRRQRHYSAIVRAGLHTLGLIPARPKLMAGPGCKALVRGRYRPQFTSRPAASACRYPILVTLSFLVTLSWAAGSQPFRQKKQAGYGLIICCRPSLFVNFNEVLDPLAPNEA